MEHQTQPHKDNKYSIIESIPRALWRHLRISLLTFFLTSVFTALICWLINRRTLYDFGGALFYAGAFLAFIGWSNFRANQIFLQSEVNLLNPMSKVAPGTYLERTRKFWLNYREEAGLISVIVPSILLCWGLGWLIINLVS